MQLTSGGSSGSGGSANGRQDGEQIQNKAGSGVLVGQHPQLRLCRRAMEHSTGLGHQGVCNLRCRWHSLALAQVRQFLTGAKAL